MRVTRFLMGLLLSALALSAAAFERPFPSIAKRGTMAPANHPQIVIDGKLRNLTAAARIWNTENLIEMPAALRGSGFQSQLHRRQPGRYRSRLDPDCG